MAIARITSTFFTNLINRLGIRPAFANGFMLSDTVLPVSLVDSDITLTSIVTPTILDTPATGGQLAAPVINTVIADTGALAAGNYSAYIVIAQDKSVSQNDYALQRRDSANAANVWTQLFSTRDAAQSVVVLTFAFTVLASERLRIIMNTAGAGTVQASIWTRVIS